MLVRRRLAKTPKQHSNSSKDNIEDADALESDTSVAVVACEDAADIILLSLAMEWRMI